MREYTIREYDKEDYEEFINNLTNEETIALLDRISSGWLPDYNFSGSENDFENYRLHSAIYRAIEIIEEMEKCN